jgi:thiol:disulfide interchange protein/DsbC/DsbD-like thiol-disulfide interchange protein
MKISFRNGHFKKQIRWFGFGSVTAALVLSVYLNAEAAEGKPARDQSVSVQLGATVQSVAEGSDFWIATRLTMDPGWHTYWLNPGAAGEPTQIRFELPVGLEEGETFWPAPKRLGAGSTDRPLVSYAYEEDVIAWTQIRVKDRVASDLGFLKVSAKVKWIACKDTCIPGKAQVELQLPIRASQAADPDEFWVRQLERVKKLWPQPAKGWRFSARMIEPSKMRIEATPPPGTTASPVQFFPLDRSWIDSSFQFQTRREGDTFILELSDPERLPVFLSELPSGTSPPIAGVLMLKEPDTQAGVKRGGTPDALEVKTVLKVEARDGVLKLVLFAILGGFLLNLMPCVFPVLALKALHLARASQHSVKKAREETLLFALGTLATFLSLAIVLIALRSTGEKLGWGFQLQSPAFIAFLAWLFTLLSFNLLGIFEWGTQWMGLGSRWTQRQDRLGSFFSGVLAVVVATPCTAPFMGTAIGAALSGGALQSLVIFTGLALGMLLPYLFLGFFPAWGNLLPKPGRWMEILKQGLAFPLLVTVVWLIWTYGVQAGVLSMARLLGAIVILGFAVWLLRIDQSRQPHSRYWPLAWLAVVISMILSLNAAVPNSVTSDGARDHSTAGAIAFKSFTAQALTDSLRGDRPIFIDFTAAWCITCQVNEQLVFSNASVQARFRELEIVAFKADWTTRKPEITAAIESYGRVGVPLYVVYLPGQKDPILLPNVLLPHQLIEVFKSVKLPTK